MQFLEELPQQLKSCLTIIQGKVNISFINLDATFNFCPHSSVMYDMFELLVGADKHILVKFLQVIWIL